MEGKQLSIWDICTKIESLIKELAVIEEKLPGRRRHCVGNWLPPTSQKVKLNFDIAFNTNQCYSSFGFTIRNDRGLVISCGVKMHKNILDAFSAEAIACI